MDRQVTIKDVARIANVSVATVSRVLNDANYPVRQELRQRVLEIAKQLGYVPNTVAKSLRKADYKDVGVIIPSISNPFYLQAVLGINEVLSNHGYHMILCNTMNDPEKEKMYLQQMAQRQVSGVIISSVGGGKFTSKYLDRGIRFVLLDQKMDDADCPGICFDTRAGAKMATEYLLSMGHRKIALATLPITRWTRNQMHMGYCDAFSEAGIKQNPEFVYAVEPQNSQSGYDVELNAGKEIAMQLIGEGMPVTAVLCVNDMLAIGLVQTLLKRNVRIPEDISVVGFDDIPFAEAIVPALTTVQYPAQESGRLAALMLVDSMGNSASQNLVNMKLSPRLILRDTVASLNE